jgi:hypothetical protein
LHNLKNYCENCKLIKIEEDNHTYECLGHNFNNKDIYVGTEFDNIFYNSDIYQICQWFIISKPKQELFLDAYKECIKNIDTLINVNINDENYQHIILTTSGPVMFTKIVNKYLPNKNICILPVDFFCINHFGSPKFYSLKNCYVKHKFTGSWK